MRQGRHGRRRAGCILAGATVIAWIPAAAAQERPADSAPERPRDHDAAERPRDRDEIVVVGTLGSVKTDIDPIATIDADGIAATGATTMPELLRALRGTTQSASGAEPIFLLNGQRVSGYAEIGTLPPEAIAKVEVLPEPAALKFGYPPTRRVVNFITKSPFRLLELRGSALAGTRGGSATETANLGLTRLRGTSRLTLALEVRRSDPAYVSDRPLVPDPEIPFDAIGNVLGVNGEIDPALSAAAGHAVSIAAVPAAPGDRASLAAYLAGADRPRAFDLGRYLTLSPENRAFKAETVLADRIAGSLAGSLTLSAERSRDRTLAGPATAVLLVPGGNPRSPFSNPVLLYRYLTETGPLRQEQTTTTLHAGALLRGALSGWRWDVTASWDSKRIDGRSERGIDPAAADAAILAGADPFAPLPASVLADRQVDVTRQNTMTTGLKAVATNTPWRLPAGRVTVTATAEVERATSDSVTHGRDPFALGLGRTRTEARVALDVPLTSRNDNVLPFLGDLSLNGSYAARRVGGFGALHDWTWGLAWSVRENVQLLATLKRSAAAPDMAMQSSPVVRIPDVPIFDFGNGRTELVALVQGGNPGLAAERRAVRSFAVTYKPFASREWRLGATYEITTIRDQAGTVYAVSPRTEALLPELFTRDASGRLTEVAFRPINFGIERQRTLNFTFNAWGLLGKPPPPAPPGSKNPPPQPPSYYGGIGPSVKFSDRLQLRPGTPEFDLLRGDSLTGAGMARAYAYAYAGVNYRGDGLTFDGWYGGGNRVRNTDPAADLRFSPILRLNLGAYVGVHRLLGQADWAKKLQLKLDVSNLTDNRQHVRDGHGRTPNRYQADYLDPVGRTVMLSLRKLF